MERPKTRNLLSADTKLVFTDFINCLNAGLHFKRFGKVEKHNFQLSDDAFYEELAEHLLALIRTNPPHPAKVLAQLLQWMEIQAGARQGVKKSFDQIDWTL